MEANFALAASSKRRGGDDFEEKFVHFFGGFGVDGAIHADDAAEGGDGIAFEGPLVGFGESLAGGGAAGVGVLDDGARPGSSNSWARSQAACRSTMLL